jgi:hypothetical protein
MKRIKQFAMFIIILQFFLPAGQAAVKSEKTASNIPQVIFEGIEPMTAARGENIKIKGSFPQKKPIVELKRIIYNAGTTNEARRKRAKYRAA